MRNLTFFLVFLVIFVNQSSFSIDESDVFPELVYWSALKKGNYDKILYYLDNGLSPSTLDNQNMSPLAYGIKSNNKQIIKLLIEYDADVNGTFLNNLSPLIYASYLNRFELIQTLLENNADVNKQDNLGKTALMVAIEKEHPKIVKQLIKSDIDVEISDYAGNTIFDYIKFIRNQEIIFMVNQIKL